MGWLKNLEDKIKPYLGPAVGAGVTAYTGNPALGSQIGGGISGLQRQRQEDKLNNLGDYMGQFGHRPHVKPPKPKPRTDRRATNYLPWVLGGAGVIATAVYFSGRPRGK